MKRNLILTTILVFVHLSNAFSQCNDPAAPGTSCQTAIAFCNNELDGFCSATYNSGVGTSVSMPPFCGSVQNNQWIRFVAGTTTISLEVTVDNCLTGDGLQAMVMHSDDCTNFTGVTNCYTASTSGGGGGTTVFTLDATDYVVGETYYFMVDGWLGDYCDYSIQVVQGSTGVAPLAAIGTPSGYTTVCPGANSITYSIDPIAGAVGYNWTVPSGVTYILSPDELTITANFSASATSGNICVEAYNDCEVGNQTCLPITMQNLTPTSDYGEYCVGSTFVYPGNNINYTAGDYYITLPGASYQGCDSIVMLEVVEHPIKETFLMEAICEGESFEIGGVPYFQTNSSLSATLASSEGCDSIVYLDLTVLDPEVVIQQPDVISCDNPDIFINGALSTADTYSWTTATGNILSGQNSPLVTVDAGGVYELTVTRTHLGVSCTASSTVTIIENYEAPSISLSTTDLSCNGSNDGTASVIATGGIPAYTYAWSNGGNTPSVSGLMPGNYTLTVSGANDCDVEEMFTITEPLALNFDITLGNSSCNGMNNGTATVNVSGGTEPYAYAWNTGSTSNVEAGLAPGDYQITITDASLCSMVESFNISEPDPIVLSTTTVQPDCGGALGTATVIASGGTGTLSYLWSGTPVQTTATATGLSEGTYTVLVTDQSNCSESIDVEIIAPDEIQLSVSGVDPTCFNGANGTASVSATGGTGTYTYAWNTIPAQNNALATGLTEGTYEVTVTDANNCTKSITIGLTNPVDLMASTTKQDILCFGEDNGTATVSVTGGAGPYTYIWDDLGNQTTTTATGLTAGNYTVIITDANNCTLSTSVILNQPSNMIEVTGTSTPAVCGGTNGTIDLTVTGGTGPFSFDWTNGIPDTEDPSGLGAGTYSVIVTDFNGCSETASVSINTPTGLEASIAISNATCFGSANGAMDITVSGGMSPFTYVWSNPSNNGNEDFINISAGDYSVTVTDSDGCSVVATGIVEQSEELTGIITPSAASCSGADGSINVTVDGGVGPFDFDWSLSAYDGQQNPDNLMPGYYSVLVTDANGCSINLATDIIVPNGPSISLTATDATCNGQNSGSLDAEVTGGTGPFTFAWDNGLSNLEDHANINAGTYTVTVSDQNSCIAIATATIAEPQGMETAMAFNGIDCFGGNSGSANVTITGGQAPFSYNWNNGQTGNTATSLLAGFATVTITDANGCSISDAIDITQSASIDVVYALTNPSCTDSEDALIDLTVTGGAGGYTYAWSNGMVTEDQSNIGQGVYGVTISDANGCSTILENINIVNPSVILLSATSSMASCNTSNGSIDLTVSGGVGTLTYAWSNGAGVIEDPSGLNSGDYEVTVMDANGCTAQAAVNVASPGGLSATASVTDALCFGANSGAIDLTITGGLAPFSYSWDNTTQAIEDPVDLPAGNYAVTIIDANNCSTTTNAQVQEPASVETSVISTIATCGASNGSIDLTVNGGTGNYTYVWSNGAVLEDPTGIPAGNYQVTVTDMNGCVAVNSVPVLTPNQLAATATVNDAVCNGDNSGSIALSISGGVGPFTFDWSNGVGTEQNPNNLLANDYAVTITDNSGCSIILNATVSEPAALASTVTANYAACGNANGSIDVTVSGGVLPYNYEWQDGIGTMEDPTGLIAGIYEVTITDNSGCEHITTGEVTTPPPYFINTITTDLLCKGDNNGDINLNVEGGIPPYTFEWNNGAVTEDISGLSADQYSVTVTDSEGCTISHATEIFEPLLLETFLLTPIQEVSCNGLSDGGIVLEVTGGTGDYTFDWNDNTLDGQQNPMALPAGDYEVIVTDLNGCVASLAATITEPEVLNIDGVLTMVNCFGGADGAIDLEVSGGTAPYAFDWNSGSFSIEDIDNVQSGQYEVLVADANNCTQTASFTLDDPEPIQINVEKISDYNGFNVSCDGESDGFVELSGQGGIAPYDFIWEDGTVMNEVSDLSQGIYTVTIADQNGCTMENQINISAPTPISGDLEILDPSCYDDNDGQIVVNNVTGGMSPYIYSIDSDYYGMSNQFDRLTGGDYEIFVQDINGCEWSAVTELINPSELIVDLGDEITVQLGDSIQLKPIVNIDALAIDTFVWNTGGFADMNPWISPTNPAAYTITITSENGCVATDDVHIRVEKERLVFVANIFTPNDDGINDLLYPQFGKGVARINTFEVFDRWGEMVYERSAFEPGDNIGWDGRLRGKPANNGVFIYFLEVVFTDGRVEIFSGDITVIK